MTTLVVLDASIVIAALSARDAHHAAATKAIIAAGDSEFVIAATTRAEILVGPCTVGGDSVARARDFIDGCMTVPVGGAIADDAAMLRARHRGLSLPDAIALVVADRIEADEVWTFDARWSSIDPRVWIPADGR